MAGDIVRLVLAADVANGGTFTVGYPSGRDNGDYAGGFAHKVISNTFGILDADLGEVSFSFGASNITVTNNSNLTLTAGTELYIELDKWGGDGFALANEGKMAFSQFVKVNLGAPIAAAANNICQSQALNSGVDGVLNGAIVTGGQARMDKPRNVVAAWTNTAVLTVRGFDEYGRAMTESSASGTSFTGLKAFARVTQVRVSANVTGLTVGTGVRLGLPVFLAQTGDVIREYQDGAIATAGTVTAGVAGAPTATTGDVRGTYAPNSAPNGALDFQLLIAVGNPGFRGGPQFAG